MKLFSSHSDYTMIDTDLNGFCGLVDFFYIFLKKVLTVGEGYGIIVKSKKRKAKKSIKKADEKVLTEKEKCDIIVYCSQKAS